MILNPLQKVDQNANTSGKMKVMLAQASSCSTPYGGG